jgi:hypothetical protein
MAMEKLEYQCKLKMGRPTAATVVKLLHANLLLVLTATGPSILISGTLGNTT